MNKLGSAWLKFARFKSKQFILAVLASSCCSMVSANSDTGTNESSDRGAFAAVAKGGLRAPAMARIVQQGSVRVAMKSLHNATANSAGVIGVAPFLVKSHGDKCSVCNAGSAAKIYDGKVCGFDVEVAYLLAEKLDTNLIIDLSQHKYDHVVDLISWGDADLAVSTLSSTLRRAQYVAFSDPYLELSQTLLVNRLAMEKLDLTQAAIVAGIPRIKPNNKSIPALTIAVEGGSSYAEFAGDLFKGHGIRRYDDLLIAMDALIKGDEVFAIYADNMQIMQLLNDNKKAGLFLKMVNLQRPDNISIATNYNDSSLLNWINLFLREIKMDGELTALKQKCGLSGGLYE